MSETPFVETFENQALFEKNWKNNSWKSPASYQLKNGYLKIATRPKTKDRVKVKTNFGFTTGVYEWRIFIPKFRKNEQVSIGAFLYHNQKEEFEFDFEIGSGQQKDRERINLKGDEAIVYCVSQFSPFHSSQYPVKEDAWSTFKMQLTDVNGFYLVEWFINNTKVKELQTQVKSDIKFTAHCSLENLHFMGDKPTTQENYVLFNSFTHKKR